MFLSASANSQILLRQAQLEASGAGNTDTLSTLAALLSFVQENQAAQQKTNEHTSQDIVGERKSENLNTDGTSTVPNTGRQTETVH